MDNDMSNLIEKVQKMVDNGNVPGEVQNMINNIKNNNSNYKSNNNNNNNNNNNINDILNNISPEMLNNFKTMFNNSSNNNSSSKENGNSSTPNIDMNTVLKMKSIMEKMNQKDDPRANLLYSLKPYLRDSKKSKIDQYVNLLNMTKIADAMNSENKKENNNA